MLLRIIITGLLCWSLTGHAVTLTSAMPEVSLTPAAITIEDPGQELSADDVLARLDKGEAATGRQFVSFGFSRSAHWLHIPLDNTESVPISKLLVIEPTWLEDVQIFLIHDGISARIHQGGALSPFDARSIAHPKINLEIDLPPGRSELLVRLASRDPVDIGMTLWNRDAFFEADALESKYWGLIYGVLGAMLLYNLFLFFSVRETAYAAYAGYLLAFLIVHATLNGLAYQAFWPDSPNLNKWALTTIIHSFMLAGLFFAVSFLELRTRLLPAYRLAIGFALLLLTSFVLSALLDGYRGSILGATLWVIIYGPFVVALSLWSLLTGNRAARFFFIGTASGFIGSCITASTTSGFIPFTFFTYRAVDFGMVIDAILLSLALADRIALVNREKELAQAELRENDDRWRLALESAGEGVWDWNVATGQVQFSRRWKEMLGYAEHELDDNFETWEKLVYPLDRTEARANVMAYLSGETEQYRNEFRMLCKDGRLKWILAQGAIVERDREGKPLRIIGTHIDISSTKQLEDDIKSLNEHLEERVEKRTHELAQAKAEAEAASLSKTRFLAAAGHDLRQPLSAANLFIDALKFTNPTQSQNQIILRLDETMSTFNRQLDALLNISKLDAGVIKPEYGQIDVVDIFEWLDHSFAPLAREKRLELRLHFPVGNRLFIRSDADLLKSVLMNLVSNAIKYTPSGTVLISARPRDGQVLFQVWDTGIGIESHQIAHIFDEFYQIDNPQRDRGRGLGLGLSIAHRALALLGAKITCRSTPGRGSTFGFSLPLDSESKWVAHHLDTQPAREERIDKSFARGKRFVVVEDDQLVAQAMVDLLEGMGGIVSRFDKAEDALARIGVNSADYFIVDYMLGGTLNGIQFLEEMRKKTGAPIKAVLMTGDTSPTFVREAAHCDWPVLHKPASTARLISSLRAQEQ